MTLPPNGRVVAAITAGISRNMQLTLPAPLGLGDAPALQGGGDLNGSANTAHLMGHAGTGLDRLSVPRQAIKVGGGNYCGVV